MINGILIFVLGTFIASVSQLLLKRSADLKHNNIAEEYFNPYIIFAYVILLVSTVLTIYAYKFIDLKITPMLDSTGYIFTPLLSFLFLKERITSRMALGIAAIVTGIVIFGIVI